MIRVVFFTSRVFGTFTYEGIAMLGEGYHPMTIEQAGLQAGMPVGPLAVTDEVTMELGRKVRVQTIKDLAAEGIAWVAHPAEAVIDRLMDEFGRNGKRTGKGFYDYPEGGKKTIWPGLAEHFTKAEKVQIDEAEFEELKERLLYRQSIESARCFEEGVLTSVADANIGSIFGIGMAPWTGGVLQYINYVGVAEFVQRADALAAKHGDRFTPPQLLRDMAAAGKTFE